MITPETCPLKDDWRNWDYEKKCDRLYMICPSCGVYGSHVNIYEDEEYRCSICGSDDRTEHNNEMHAQEMKAKPFEPAIDDWLESAYEDRFISDMDYD